MTGINSDPITLGDYSCAALCATVVALGAALAITQGSVDWATIGLALDVAGFLCVFWFGVPSKVHGALWNRMQPPRLTLFRRASWTGAVLIIAGFALQFIGRLT